MSDIPRDIMDAAEQFAADLDDIHFNSRSASWLDDARDIVARAFLEERKRVLTLLDVSAPHSPRRYIFDVKPDRRIWACGKLEAAIGEPYS